MSKILIAAAAVATLMAGSAFAAETQSAAVSTAGVNFQSRAESEAVLTKIVAAAQEVCRIDSTNKYVAKSDTICVDRAVSGAVRSANRPQLTAAYQNASTSALAYNDR